MSLGPMPNQILPDHTTTLSRTARGAKDFRQRFVDFGHQSTSVNQAKPPSPANRPNCARPQGWKARQKSGWICHLCYFANLLQTTGKEMRDGTGATMNAIVCGVLEEQNVDGYPLRQLRKVPDILGRDLHL